jgi:ABC-type glycerol-3-phosphate transport system permease component
MLVTSFSIEARIFTYPPSLLPDPFTTDNYRQLFQDTPVARALFNSAIVAILSTVGLVSSSAMGAYSLARIRFHGRSIWFAIILATLFIPGQVMLIPQYWIFQHIHWVNTLLPLVVPPFFGGAFGIFLPHQFFKGIPEDLADAARVDGANPLNIFLLIMLPLATPALAALAIFQFLGSWNDLLTPLIYLSSETMFTFPLELTRFKHHLGPYMWTLVTAGAFIGTVPPIIVYLIGERRFVQGIVLRGRKR